MPHIQNEYITKLVFCSVNVWVCSWDFLRPSVILLQQAWGAVVWCYFGLWRGHWSDWVFSLALTCSLSLSLSVALLASLHCMTSAQGLPWPTPLAPGASRFLSDRSSCVVGVSLPLTRQTCCSFITQSIHVKSHVHDADKYVDDRILVCLRP